MIVLDKWKRFAVSHVIESHTGTPEEVYDAMDGADYNDTDGVFSQYGIDERRPFDLMCEADVSDFVMDLAVTAQRCSEEA